MIAPPDGLAVCRMLSKGRMPRPIPILMLTARSEEVDRVLGLEMGADDYIVKPFSLKELCARVRAVIRRKEYLSSGGQRPLKVQGIWWSTPPPVRSESAASPSS